MKALIIDDNQNKIQNISAVLCEAGFAPHDIHSAGDIISAKRELKTSQFGLMVVDIVLPLRPDCAPIENGGVTLLDEISKRDIYCTPPFIIAITAFDEIASGLRPSIEDKYFQILHYSLDGKDWRNRLHSIAKLAQARSAEEHNVAKYRYGLAVLCALDTPEFKAVLDLDWNWEPLPIDNDIAEYYTGSVQIGEKQVSVVGAAAPRMGMVASAVLASKIISRFLPKYLCMTGICGGVEGTAQLGDIIAADESWDYQSGKHTSKPGTSLFEIAPHHISIDPFLRSKLQQFSRDSAALERIRGYWRPKRPQALSLHVAPMASGSAVIADKELLTQVRTQNRKMMGIDMEAYGIFASALYSPTPTPKAFILKSVSDFANCEKDDSSQDYAAFTSAQALDIFLREYLFK